MEDQEYSNKYGVMCVLDYSMFKTTLIKIEEFLKKKSYFPII